jgi:hypothetical protein
LTNSQEYVGQPRVVNFTPVLRRSLPSLRRRGESGTQVGRPGIEGTSEQLYEVESSQHSDVLIEECETIRREIESGKFYVVLGDSLQGYYLVKCLTFVYVVRCTVSTIANKLVYV